MSLADRPGKHGEAWACAARASRRWPGLAAGIVLLVACSATDREGAEVTGHDWNVVLVTLDTVRADALGAYGQKLPTTPHLDRIAGEGVLFEQAVASAPHTLASHASIFTGLHPPAHGVRGNHGFGLSPQNLTLAEILKARGYRTGAEIAAPVLRAGTRIAQGFDQTREGAIQQGTAPSTHAGSVGALGLVRTAENISDRGIEFLRAHVDTPFFLWLHYFDAHHPYAPPPAFRARFPHPYLAEVAALDAQLGRVLEELDASGLRERTLVIVTSDHGEGLGEHGESSHTFFVYESTMRVPLLFWGPSVLPIGLRVEPVVRTVDILPSVLDWLGAPPVPGIDGRSLRPLVEGPEAEAQRVAYGEALDLYRVFGTTPLRFVREGRWKYIHKVNPELYDLETDPAELRNLATDRPEIVARLEGELRRYLAASAPAPQDAATETTAATEAQLEALGYLAPSGTAPLPGELEMLAPMGPDPAALAADLSLLSATKGLLDGRRFQRAEENLRPLLARHPASGTVNGLLAKALAGRGEREESLVLFRRALELEGAACSHLRLDFARALEGFGRHREQHEVLSAGVALCPSSGSYRNDYAWALATVPEPSLRDGARALELARALVIEGEGEPDANHLDTLAAAFAATGDFESAEREQRRAITILARSGERESVVADYRERAQRYAREEARASP